MSWDFNGGSTPVGTSLDDIHQVAMSGGDDDAEEPAWLRGSLRVVKNAESQYSLWPDGELVPNGWLDGGFVGSKPECLRFIEQMWTDITPLSHRVKTEQGPFE